MLLGILFALLQSPLPRIEDEQAAKQLCARYENYEVTVPEGWSEEEDGRALAEMFANGTDVRQDFGAAIHFLCSDGMLADAELWSMLDHVGAMQRGETAEPLDFCAHATSRYGGIVCAGRRDSEEGPQLEERFEAIRATSGKAIEPLREKATDFISADAHYEEEEYRGGTMYAYAGTHAVLDREKRFVELLELYSQERAPAASQADFRRADAALNAAYRKRMAGIAPCDAEYVSCEGPSQQDNLKAAQRLWVPYRDAWIAYYQERWRGKAKPDALRREIATAITKSRTEELRANMEE